LLTGIRRSEPSPEFESIASGSKRSTCTGTTCVTKARADGVDIRVIQLMLGHSDIKTTQRYLNITDEGMRRALNGVWERRRQLRLETTSNEEPVEGLAVGQ
jgi:hypothetical protein